MYKKRVLIVGSAKESGGGVSAVIRMITKMPIFSDCKDGNINTNKWNVFWLGTQIQRNYLWKLWYAVKGNIIAFFIIWRYDIIHFNTVPDRPGLLIQLPILLMAKLWHKKVIMHIHMGNQLYDHTNNKLFIWCLKRADKIVLLGECFKSVIIKEYGFSPDKLAVVYNATENITHTISDVNHENLIIMAGYFDENKAPDVLMKSLYELNLNHKLNGWKAILMGNGNIEKYKGICHELGLDDIVSFPGYVTGIEKEDIWSKASIFCLCSHVEGFPMVVLEAWNYGIPVVSTRVGGLPDVIEEDKNCCTFDFDDFDGLSRQLQKLMNNENLRTYMSRYEQNFVRENFSVEKVNMQLEELYNSL